MEHGSLSSAIVTFFKLAAMDTPGHGNCYSHAMTQGINAVELDDLEMQVRRSRPLIRQSEIKVEAIVASIHEVEKFHPKIKIIRGSDNNRQTAEEGISLFAANLILKIE
jgi:hypothetical protein